MVENSMYHTHISAKHRWMDLNLKEVWQYRDLIYLFTKRNFVVSYKQTILGPAWIFLTPLFTSIVQAFVFGGIAGIGTDGIPTFLFYLCSNAVWAYFANCLTSNANTFTANAYVFGKVYFPRLVMPCANIIYNTIGFLINFVMFFILVLIYMFTGSNVHPNLCALLMPLILLSSALLGTGCGLIVSSVTTKYRDLGVLVSFGVTLWMYITPVVYPVSQVSDSFRPLALLNPVAPLIETFRYGFLGSGTFPWQYLILSFAVTAVVLLFGIIVFNRVEKNFIDTV